MTPVWIAADWGPTNLRLWAIGADGSVLGERETGQGMGRMDPAQCEAVLVDLAADWLDTADHVVACGEVGSPQGWGEAPYQTTPCAVSPCPLVKAPVTRAGLTVHVIRGILQTSPADVMCGEETRIAGFLAQHDDWDGVLCLPGPHTKWVHVSANEVVSFRTFMTGEMFALLADQSVLQHAIADTGWDEAAFMDALSHTLSKPETMAARLFELRAAQLVHSTDTITARSQLSGLLIGAELAAAKPYWLGQQVAIVGAEAISVPYVSGLAAQGVPATRTDAKTATLDGLKAAYALLKG